MTGLLGGFNRTSFLKLEYQSVISIGDLDLELGKGLRALEPSDILHNIFSATLNVSFFFPFSGKRESLFFYQILKGL